MKRIILAAAAALLPLFLACNKEDSNKFKEPAYAQYACQLIPVNHNSPASAPKRLSTATVGTIVSIELTESGFYVIGQMFPATEGPQYTTGRYSVKGKLYTLEGFGSLEFDNSTAGEISVTIKPNGGIVQTILATLKKALRLDQLNRSWTVDKTRITVYAWTTASADFNGCDFHEIAEFLLANHHKAPTDIEPGFGLKTITFTGNNSAIFTYTDNSVDMGEFSMNGNTLTYKWEYDPRGFTFLIDNATIEYLDGKCLLTIDAQIQNSTTSGSVTFVLSPMD